MTTIQLDSLSRPARRPARATYPSATAADGSAVAADRGASALRRPAAPVAPERFRPRVPARRRPPAGLVSPRPLGVPARRPACDGARQEGYRMGRWARLAVTLTVFVTAVLLVTGALPTSSAVDPGSTVEVSVEPGDTLWSIARDAAPGGNTGAVVEQIRQLNGLGDTGSLPAGLVLVVPAG